MGEQTNIEWQVGDYAKHRGSLVQIEGLRNPTSLKLIAYYERGVGITRGGHTVLGGDQTSNLEPITEARDLLIVKGYAALEAIENAKLVIAENEIALKVYTEAVKALAEAQEAARG